MKLPQHGCRVMPLKHINTTKIELIQNDWISSVIHGQGNTNTSQLFCENSTFAIKCKVDLEAVINLVFEKLGQFTKITLSTYDQIPGILHQHQMSNSRPFREEQSNLKENNFRRKRTGYTKL